MSIPSEILKHRGISVIEIDPKIACITNNFGIKRRGISSSLKELLRTSSQSKFIRNKKIY